jgi:DMSO reductase anchor subunit
MAGDARMKDILLAINHSFLFLCVSMYLGTGGSLILFSFPVVPQLTVDNYYLEFVPQVTTATAFLTWMTALMSAAGLVMAAAEWHHRLRWVPILVLLAITAATTLTLVALEPLNNEMASHITDPARLAAVLNRWMMLNRIRVTLWCVEWAAMMYYFATKYLAAAAPSSPVAARGS